MNWATTHLQLRYAAVLLLAVALMPATILGNIRRSSHNENEHPRDNGALIENSNEASDDYHRKLSPDAGPSKGRHRSAKGVEPEGDYYPGGGYNPYDPSYYKPRDKYYKKPDPYQKPKHYPRPAPKYDPNYKPSSGYKPRPSYGYKPHDPYKKKQPSYGYDHKPDPFYPHDPYYPSPKHKKDCCFTDKQACDIFAGASPIVVVAGVPLNCPTSTCFCPHYVEKYGGYGYSHEKDGEEEKGPEGTEETGYYPHSYYDPGQVKCLPSFADYCNRFNCQGIGGNAPCIDVVQQCCPGWCYSCHTQAQKCDAYARVDQARLANMVEPTCTTFQNMICPDEDKNSVAFDFACMDPAAFCRAYLADKDGNSPAANGDADCQGNCELAFASAIGPNPPGPGCCGCP